MFETEALKSLGAFPIVQAAVALLVLLAGIWLMRRGERDKKIEAPDQIPQWIMMGPAHDAIGAVHDIAEQCRRNTELLGRIEEHSRQTAEEARRNTGILEMI